MVQWLRLYASTVVKGVWVQSLVRELRSDMAQAQQKKNVSFLH